MSKTITFNKDFHPEFDGYLSEQGTGVFISFIQSKQEGKDVFNYSVYGNKKKTIGDWLCKK